MTIIVTGRKLDQSVAEDIFRDACQYLRQSRFAAFLLNELMTVPQLLHIEVTASPLSRNKDAWRRPKNSEPHSAGRVLWNLSSGYFAGEHGNTRPGLGELERAERGAIRVHAVALAIYRDGAPSAERRRQGLKALVRVDHHNVDHPRSLRLGPQRRPRAAKGRAQSCRSEA